MRLRIGILVLLCLAAAASMAQAATWKKHVAADKSYSFHYPSGWTVTPRESIIEIESPAATDEALLLIAVPGDESKTPRQLSEDAVTILRGALPDLEASNWQSAPGTDGSIVFFEIACTSEGTSYTGVGALLKTGDKAHWFSYTGPTKGYSAARALELLQGLLTSISTGTESKPPAAPAAADPTKIEKNARAMLFVLEFALGAPLPVAQEHLILSEIKKDWAAKSAQEFVKHDAYPGIVNSILSMSQSDLGKLQSQLSASMQAWIEESDPSNPGIAAIKAALDKRGKVLVDGTPPLTEITATAYSEITAYSQLLHANPKARIDQIKPASVSKIRGQLIDSWTRLSDQDRQDVAAMPGLWMVMRTLMSQGTADKAAQMRDQIRGLTSAPQQVAKAGSSGGRGKPSGKDKSLRDQVLSNMIKHNSLMAIQKMNFNTYMWSRGFNYHPTIGKMW